MNKLTKKICPKSGVYILTVDYTLLAQSDYLLAYGYEVAFLNMRKRIFLNYINVIVTDVYKSCDDGVSFIFFTIDLYNEVFAFVRSKFHMSPQQKDSGSFLPPRR